MEKLVSIGEAAEMLGVTDKTLRMWDKAGKLVPIRTPGKQRRYRVSDLEKFQGLPSKAEAETKQEIAAQYSRVSSHEQKEKGDLDRQTVRLSQFCAEKKYQVAHVLTDVGSGMSANRPRLKQLFKLVEDHAITKVIVEHKDRLTRFNFGVYERFFLSHGVTIEWVDSNKSKTYEEELVDDMISLMSSFSSKIYGKRSAENRKKRKLEKLTKLGTDLVETKKKKVKKVSAGKDLLKLASQNDIMASEDKCDDQAI